MVGDLCAATGTHKNMMTLSRDARRGKHNPFDKAVHRMCVSHLIVTLAKWEEFRKYFHRVIPGDCRETCKALQREIDSRRVRHFRNKVAGHLWDTKRDRPLNDTELEAEIQIVTKGDGIAFLKWCNNPEIPANPPGAVVSIVEHVRDRIIAEYNLSKADLFPSKQP